MAFDKNGNFIYDDSASLLTAQEARAREMQSAYALSHANGQAQSMGSQFVPHRDRTARDILSDKIAGLRKSADDLQALLDALPSKLPADADRELRALLAK